MDPRHLPGQHLAGRGRRPRSRWPGRSCAAIPKSSWSVARSAGPTTAPTRPASTTSSSSCRSSPRRTGRRSRTQTGWRRCSAARRSRTKDELVEDMNAELRQKLIGVDWNFSQYIRDNVMEALSGVKGDNSVKIIGPDLDELEQLADRGQEPLERHARHRGRGHLPHHGPVEPGVPRRSRTSASYWGVSVADVNNVIQTAVGGKAFTQMIEGEKTFDITLRWPDRLRGDEQAILQHPGGRHQQHGHGRRRAQRCRRRRSPGPAPASSADRHSIAMPSQSRQHLRRHREQPQQPLPRLPLRDLVTPGGRRGPARSQRAASSGRALRPSTASRAIA